MNVIILWVRIQITEVWMSNFLLKLQMMGKACKGRQTVNQDGDSQVLGSCDKQLNPNMVC